MMDMHMEIDPPVKQEELKINEKDLYKAAETGDSSAFKELSREQLSKALSLRNEDGRSLLHVAASSGHPEVVKLLADIEESKSVVNCGDEEGWITLHSAVSFGNVEIVEALLSKGADVNLRNNGGRVALHYAAGKGWLKIAELLIAHGAKINSKDEVGCSPLHRAASTGNSELCELLIEEGAEVDAVDKAGQTALMYAVICHNKGKILFIMYQGGALEVTMRQHRYPQEDCYKNMKALKSNKYFQ
ncbi:26S proteasome non-ATPase regulatory subunit 10-like isoform X2 [Tripterygium wilfordii]|uniref:26S proteasome non-ATPase regulatory subunit 10-like isoform X2 n=1 Tax=Tripterygium wilfordii TaxID=458696 RepID=UPI0018F83AF1|nr:26S proteasome non-ATPase regulatory subunit 10-like isoform X2 [Tripterygium wilfordii]